MLNHTALVPPRSAGWTPDRRNRASREALLYRVRSEYSEMPCLRLTCAQAQRLFDLRSDICQRVMSALIARGVLVRGADSRYGLRESVINPRRLAPADR
jgi:hypothetical protein